MTAKNKLVMHIISEEEGEEPVRIDLPPVFFEDDDDASVVEQKIIQAFRDSTDIRYI